MEFTAEMIAGFLGGDVVGDKNAKVSAFAKIEEGAEGALSFLSNPKYEPHLYTTDSSIVIVNRSLELRMPVKATMIRVDDAYGSFAKLLELYVANKPRKKGISPLASIHETARLGKDCYVGQFAVIEEDVVVGDNCLIYPQVYVGDRVRIGNNVTIFPGVTIYEDCVIGNDIAIHSGAVIGADGFGWAPLADGTYEKIPQIGNVVLEDGVDVGANTCIDRATMGSTVVKKGVKLDNLIQIAHNASIGENTVIAAQSGIAGSAKVGRNCVFAGQVGVVGHVTVGDRVTIGSKSGASRNVGNDESYLGFPPVQAKKYHRANAVFRNLASLDADVYQLKKQMANLLDSQK